MKNTPTGWPRISPAIFYADAATAIDWLCRAFGFEVRLKVVGDGGTIEHSELTYGDGLVMVGTASKPRTPYTASPQMVSGKNTQSLMLYVDDVNAHCARARAAGATITWSRPITTTDSITGATAATVPSISRGTTGGSRSAFATIDSELAGTTP